MKLRTRVTLLAIFVTTICTLIVDASPADASTVYGWGSGTYIAVETGAKNYSNKTQWVSSITIVDGANRCDGGKAEAWVSRPGAIDWYTTRAMCNSTMFYVSRWVPSGSEVCGSNWFKQGDRWWRGVACIRITV
jgi:hypothetical protein